MGMDVWGKNPAAPSGRYFRANIWSWRPIHALMVELCADLFDDQTLARLGINVGAGPDNQALCDEVARRFANWLEHHCEGHRLEMGLRVTREGRFVTEAEQAANPGMETVSPYQVDDEHLKQWVEFLRHCGGFEVW